MQLCEPLADSEPLSNRLRNFIPNPIVGQVKHLHTAKCQWTAKRRMIQPLSSTSQLRIQQFRGYVVHMVSSPVPDPNPHSIRKGVKQREGG